MGVCFGERGKEAVGCYPFTGKVYYPHIQQLLSKSSRYAMWEENLHTPDISILSYFKKQKKIIRLLGTAALYPDFCIRPCFL